MWWIDSHWNQSAQPLQWGVAILASLVAAVLDVRAHRIPNWLTGPVFAAGLVWSVLMGGGAGLADAMIGCFVMMFLFVVLFVFAGGGAGDAKLMGALGVWLGVVNGLFALGGVLLAGGVLAIVQSIAKRRLGCVLRNMGYLVLGFVFVLVGRGRLGKAVDMRLADGQVGAKIPYGVGIFLGVCLAAAGVLIWRNGLT